MKKTAILTPKFGVLFDLFAEFIGGRDMRDRIIEQLPNLDWDYIVIEISEAGKKWFSAPADDDSALTECVKRLIELEGKQ